MRWAEPHLKGFMLAATLASDRAARTALPGLTRAAQEAPRRTGEALAALEATTRRRHIAALATQLRAPGVAAEHWAAHRRRLWALLDAGGELGASPHRTPPARVGFVPEPGLLQLVRRIARSPKES